MTGLVHSEAFTVVVLANGTNGLGVVRSLKRAGLKSIVIAPSSSDLAALSNIPEQKYIIPLDGAWEQNVLHLLSSFSFDYKPPILACSDRAANFIASNMDSIGCKYNVLSPSAELTESLNDKRFEIEKMKALAIPLPHSISRLDSLDFDEQVSTLKYPLILKPRSFAGYEIINAKNIILNNINEVMDFKSDYASHLDQFVVQEVIAGDDDQLWVCNATFDKSSRLIAAFTFQRKGTMPSHYGVTSLAISRLNPTVIALVESIGRGIAYVGPAMFEFKYDAVRNEYLYIEINPRLGMCNWFDTCCGINNPAIAAYLACQKDVFEIPTQKDNFIYWNFLGDLIARLEDREPIKGLLLRVFGLLFKKKVWAIFVWLDPYPAINSAFYNVKLLVTRVIKAIKR